MVDLGDSFSDGYYTLRYDFRCTQSQSPYQSTSDPAIIRSGIQTCCLLNRCVGISIDPDDTGSILVTVVSHTLRDLLSHNLT